MTKDKSIRFAEKFKEYKEAKGKHRSLSKKFEEYEKKKEKEEKKKIVDEKVDEESKKAEEKKEKAKEKKKGLFSKLFAKKEPKLKEDWKVKPPKPEEELKIKTVKDDKRPKKEVIEKEKPEEKKETQGSETDSVSKPEPSKTPKEEERKPEIKPQPKEGKSEFFKNLFSKKPKEISIDDIKKGISDIKIKSKKEQKKIKEKKEAIEQKKPGFFKKLLHIKSKDEKFDDLKKDVQDLKFKPEDKKTGSDDVQKEVKGLFDFLWRLKLKGEKDTKRLGKIEKTLKQAEEKEEEKREEKKKKEKKEFLSNLEMIRKKQQKKSKIKVTRYEKVKHLKSYLEKAGYSVSKEPLVAKRINILSIISNFIFTFYILYAGLVRGDSIIFVFTQIVVSWLAVFPAFIFLYWAIFYFVIDFQIYNRKKQLEEVLPDFLQLTSSNINAGMPLDQALWYAVRPRFGVLAKEIEDVAKSTLVGEELKDALINFSKRYESQMLKRTVNLMLEGLDAGGQIGSLLNKIAVDIQETRIIRKDMAASVTTYVIFISFATVVAAPFLFALSNQMLVVIQSLVSNIRIPENVPTTGMISMSFSDSSVSLRDYKIFAISALAMTSFFSAMITSIIQKGNVKDGIKYIPTFIIISIVLFLIATRILGYFLGGLI